MAEILFTRAVIPTNSLRLIYEAVGNLLDPHIRIIRATASSSYPAEKSRPHRNVRVYQTAYTKVEARFNKGTSRDNFDIEAVLDTCSDIPIHDLWVHRLILRFKYSLGPFDFDFQNRPLTSGSEAERWVASYLKSLKEDGLITRAQLRHLPLISAMTVPRGGHLDGETLDDPSFVRWLSRETNGLVKLKTVRRLDEETFIDVKIREPM
ncbi:unnamed protein product, partial [marine sediment metagenome]